MTRARVSPFVEQAVLSGALLAAAFLQHTRGGLEPGLAGVALLLLAPAAWRWEHARGRVSAAPAILRLAEAAIVAGALAFRPGPPWVLALGGVVASCYAVRVFVPGRDEPAPGTSLEATDLARVAALAGVALALSSGRLSPALPALVVLELVEARTAPGSAADRARRCAAFALLAASELRPAVVGTPEALARVALAWLLGLVVLIRAASRAGRTLVERVATLAFALALVHETSRLVPLETSAGRALEALVVGGLALTVFFLTGSSFAPDGARRPGVPGAILAMAVAASTAAIAGPRCQVPKTKRWSSNTAWEQGSDLAHRGASPLSAVAPKHLFGQGATARDDIRGRPFTPRREDGTLRVLLLGGSSAFGHVQPKREESPVGCLERALAARLTGRRPGPADLAAARPGPADLAAARPGTADLAAARPGTADLAAARPEVVCLACPGFTSDQELASLAGARLLGWEADLVLAVDGYNDVNYLAGKGTYPGDLYVWPQHRHALGYPLRRALCLEAPALRSLFGGAAVLPAARAEDWLGDANGFYLDALVANEEALVVLARELGARFAWTSAPLVYDLPRLTPEERDAPREASFAEVVRRRTREARARVAPAVAARGGIVLDLPGALARRRERTPDEAWFSDDCHYTDRGAVALAEELADLLIAQGAVTSR